MRAEWVTDDALRLALAALMLPNRLAIEVSISTGLRIGDVLQLTVKQVEGGRPSVREQKTGKSRRIYIPQLLQRQLLAYHKAACPRCKYIFPARSGCQDAHRTRQAVYKDVRRAADGLRLGANMTPHSARKVYAVDRMRRTGSLNQVQRDLNHSDPAVTLIYAMADKIGGTAYSSRCRIKRQRKKRSPKA